MLIIVDQRCPSRLKISRCRAAEVLKKLMPRRYRDADVFKIWYRAAAATQMFLKNSCRAAAATQMFLKNSCRAAAATRWKIT